MLRCFGELTPDKTAYLLSFLYSQGSPVFSCFSLENMTDQNENLVPSSEENLSDAHHKDKNSNHYERNPELITQDIATIIKPIIVFLTSLLLLTSLNFFSFLVVKKGGGGEGVAEIKKESCKHSVDHI